jgi:hypothetical protein
VETARQGMKKVCLIFMGLKINLGDIVILKHFAQKVNTIF